MFFQPEVSHVFFFPHVFYYNDKPFTKIKIIKRTNLVFLKSAYLDENV